MNAIEDINADLIKIGQRRGYARNTQFILRHEIQPCGSRSAPANPSPRFKGMVLRSLAPLGPNADQTTDGTGDADQAVVEGRNAQRRGRGSQITQVGDELYPGGRALPTNRISIRSGSNGEQTVSVLLNLLRLNNALALLAVNRLLLLPQTDEGVHARDSAKHETSSPGTIGMLL